MSSHRADEDASAHRMTTSLAQTPCEHGHDAHRHDNAGAHGILPNDGVNGNGVLSSKGRHRWPSPAVQRKTSHQADRER